MADDDARGADRVAHGQAGIGRLYQGRYKSFLLEDDRHFLTVCRYVGGSVGASRTSTTCNRGRPRPTE